MKILQLGKAYPPQNLGGVEITIQLITEGLHERGIYCDVLGVNDINKSKIEEKEYGVIYREALIKKLYSTLLSIKLVFRLYKIKDKYDIIHIHHPDPMCALAFWIVRPKCKLIVHWHSDIIRQKFLLKFYKPIQTWLLKRADIIIATSPNYANNSNYLLKFLNKVIIIPIGINRDMLMPDIKLVENIKSEYKDKNIILAIGRIAYYKGYEFLINSCKDIDDKSIVLIVGDGELRPELQLLIDRNSLNHKVKFVGSVSNIQKNSYLHACDLFVLSSIFKTEAFAIVQLEAMALGKPIISTEIPGSGVQWVNQNGVSGLVVPIKDSHLLAEAINDVINNISLKAILSKGALDRFEKEFTLHKMINRIVDLYNSLIEI